MYNNTIYVANDSPTITEAIVDILKEKGFEDISTFTDGRELLERLKTKAPALIISDISMPVIDGYQLCRILRSDEFREYNKIPIILISATYRDAIAEKLAYELGANAFLQYPYDSDDLIKLVYTNLLIDVSAIKKPYKRKALVADDDPNILNALQFFLAENGYDVITANDGEDAVTAFEREKPQILFLDYQMPKKDGIEVMRWVRENRPETGIVMMTAFGSELKAVEMMKAGADDYIKKPFDIKTIPEICERVFNRYNTRLIDRQFREKAIERERMMEQLIQAEKLSSIGTLVSGIAHELNNPLTGIIGYTELLLYNKDISNNVKNDLEKIHKEADRCVKIVRNLLTFARRYKAEKGMANINDILKNTLDLIAYQLKANNISLITQLDNKIPRTYGDHHQLQQVFLNIITNAMQAMHEYRKRGTLTIKTEMADDNSIRISFKNDGPPIPEDYRHKIFDPFFTTKGVGKGTGLGLSMSLGIVKDHNGSITAENIVDTAGSQGGVVFTILLPVARPPAQKEELTKAILSKIPGKRILIVEDEENIRDVIKKIIEGEGHIIKLSANGTEAIEAVRLQEFDLIITDLSMPDFDGITLYKKATEIRPELKNRFILITGTIINEAVEFFEEKGNRYLQKPFKHAELKRLLKEIFQ